MTAFVPSVILDAVDDPTADSVVKMDELTSGHAAPMWSGKVRNNLRDGDLPARGWMRSRLR